MDYNNIYDEFLKYFPEDTAILNGKAEELSVEPSDGMHVVFGMVVALCVPGRHPLSIPFFSTGMRYPRFPEVWAYACSVLSICMRHVYKKS